MRLIKNSFKKSTRKQDVTTSLEFSSYFTVAACVPGTFSSTSGSSNCIQCRAGMYSKDFGSTACKGNIQFGSKWLVDHIGFNELRLSFLN